MPNARESERIGQYSVRVAFRQPDAGEQPRTAHRLDALVAWLLARWEAERREERHDEARAAG